jgi:hypothetical protein
MVRKEVMCTASVVCCSQQLVERESPEILRAVQQLQVPCHGFTAMKTGAFGNISSLENWRSRCLKDLGLVFSPFSRKIENFQFQTNFLEKMRLLEGVIFSGGEKGGSGKCEALRMLLKHYTFGEKNLPDTILMVDDLEDNLIFIDKVLQEFGISFIGLKYEGGRQYNKADIDALAPFAKKYGQMDF